MWSPNDAIQLWVEKTRKHNAMRWIPKKKKKTARNGKEILGYHDGATIQNLRYLKRRRGWRGRMHSDCSANELATFYGLVDYFQYTLTDIHYTYNVMKKNVSFNVFFFFFLSFFLFLLLYNKVVQLKTIDFFRSHIFSLRVIFCLIHPVPRSSLKQKWHGPHQRLAYCNRTGIH